MRYNLKLLFEYLGQEFGEIKETMKEQSRQFSNLQTSVDKIAATVDKHTAEFLIMNHRITRIESNLGINKSWKKE